MESKALCTTETWSRKKHGQSVGPQIVDTGEYRVLANWRSRDASTSYTDDSWSHFLTHTQLWTKYKTFLVATDTEKKKKKQKHSSIGIDLNQTKELKITHDGIGEVAQLVGCLLSMSEALSLISTA